MFRRTDFLARAALGAALLIVVPRAVAAQQDVYGPSDLSAAPKLVSTAATARLIARSYPEAMRRENQGGQVQIEFVVGRDGKVEPGSITVVETSAPALGSAARTVAQKMEFVPAKKDGQTVRARVQLPIVYKP
jgi:periplasmic protein TonB